MYQNSVPGYFTDLDLDVVSRIARMAPRKGLIVEVGAHFGRSVVGWADNVSKHTKIFVVDPWDQWEWPIPAPRECIPKELRDVKEDPRKWHEGDLGTLPMSLDDAFLNRYEVFQHYTKQFKNVYPIRDKSPPQKHHVEHLSNIDIIFLDGDHSAEGIEKDIHFWFPLMKKNGILCGHDYTPNHAKMVQKIKHFSETLGLPLWENPLKSNLWVMTQNMDQVKETVLKNEFNSRSSWLELIGF
jgi:hypothetical protein